MKIKTIYLLLLSMFVISCVPNFDPGLSQSGYIPDGYENGYEYVDLGLPSGTLWATCNVGAVMPEENGSYFAWGETKEKLSYTISNHKFTSYVDQLPISVDAAHVNMGGQWRMPTKYEQDELRNADYCTWMWINQNGVNGYKVISNINGKYIFLPAGGYAINSNYFDQGSVGYYWSRNGEYGSDKAYEICFLLDSYDWTNKGYTYLGQAVRGVYDPSLSVKKVYVYTNGKGTAKSSYSEVEKGDKVTLTATPNEGYEFVNWTVNGEEVSTSNPYSTVIKENTNFVANFIEEQRGEYTVELNSQWRTSSSIQNPNSLIYDGVYESFSNYLNHSQAAVMYIKIKGYTNFEFYIRSYGESNYDYIMVSQLDETIDNNTAYSSSLVKAHTRGDSNSGTLLSDYKLVKFEGIDKGEHIITVLYRKDLSSNVGSDRGYVLIPKSEVVSR